MENNNNNTTDIPTLQEKFAKFVKEKRTALGWTQPDLAERVFGERRYKNYISQIENGVRKGMSVATMGRILVELKSDIEFVE